MFDQLKITDHHIYKGGDLPKMTAIGYQYLLAGNGLFVQAQNPHWQAVIPVAACVVRGLPLLQTQVVCRHGLIPSQLLTSILVDARDTSQQGQLIEMLYRIHWREDGLWYVTKPPQEASPTWVKTSVPADDNTVLELHTHGNYAPHFSPTDNEDEKGLCLYGVIGYLNKPTPEIQMRFGIYGHVAQIQVKPRFTLEDWPIQLTHERPEPIHL